MIVVAIIGILAAIATHLIVNINTYSVSMHKRDMQNIANQLRA
jgi:type II secretory pathway pseudopilin PulG